MTSLRRVDYLVVGYGLAGALTADSLRRRGRSVLVVDDPNQVGSSRVAAGLINPVTGPRFALNRDVDRLLPEASTYYRELEVELRRTLWSDLALFRVFRNADERSRWEARRGKAAFVSFAGPLHDSAPGNLPVHAPWGGAEIRHAARVDLSALLDGLSRRAEFIPPPGGGMNSALRFDTRACRIEKGGVVWRNITAGCVVCCEGARVVDNDWFRGIPWVPVKGEMLMIRLPNFPARQVVAGGVTLVPLGKDRFYAGATYDRERADAQPTEEGRASLCERLEEMVSLPFEVALHAAGIRPVARRRTPVLGMHPELPRVALLNGLGSRGALAAPACVRQLVALLEDGQPPDRELDIRTHWTRSIQ